MFAYLRLEHFHRASKHDPGCAATRELLDVYAEAVAAGELSAIERYWRLTIHLGACGECRNHFHGLLAALHQPE